MVRRKGSLRIVFWVSAASTGSASCPDRHERATLRGMIGFVANTDFSWFAFLRDCAWHRKHRFVA